MARKANSPAVAVAVLDFSHLTRVLKRYHTLGNVKVSLYLRDGTYVAHYPDPESRMGRTNAHTRLFSDELPKAEQGTYHAFADVSQEHRIFSYLAVEGYPLVVQISMPRGIALAPWYGRIGLTGGLAILAILAAAVATGMIHRQARRLGVERLKALEAQLTAEHASRSKSEFLAHMSHELRTPMNAVIGFSQMMSSEIFGPVGSPKYHEYLNDIATSGQHLLQVVNNVLDLAKVEAGKWEMQEEVVGIRELCLAATQMVRERARSAGIVIEIARDAPELSVCADPRLLRQILINLVINSIKFTEPGGRVRLGWGPARRRRRGDRDARHRRRHVGRGRKTRARAVRPRLRPSRAHAARDRPRPVAVQTLRRDAWRVAGDRERARAWDHGHHHPAEGAGGGAARAGGGSGGRDGHAAAGGATRRRLGAGNGSLSTLIPKYRATNPRTRVCAKD